jgi:hypothetical protein
MAMIFGWIIIVPPFIAMYNTARHVQGAEERMAIQPQLERALVIVIMILLSVANGVYIQEHLNLPRPRLVTPRRRATPPSAALGDRS